MKRILIGMISVACVIFLISCADEADPQFRITNERPDKANVQIQTTGGNTININDVQSGQTTEYQSAPEGDIVVTAVIQNVSISPTATFFASKDSRTTIVLLAGTTPIIRIDR
jgi:hypothetical protein